MPVAFDAVLCMPPKTAGKRFRERPFGRPVLRDKSDIPDLGVFRFDFASFSRVHGGCASPKLHPCEEVTWF
jgi:hypothetical protein